MFGRNLYETDETISILENRLAWYCPIFEQMKSPFLTVADFLSLCLVTLLILMQVSFCILWSADTGTKVLGDAL